MVLPNFPVSFSELPDQFNRGIITHFQATNSTLFQFLVPDSKAITIPNKQLDLILSFIDEDENISTHQLVWNKFPYWKGSNAGGQRN
jgi:hypothetical protein